MYVCKVNSYSSTYGGENSIMYTMENIIGGVENPFTCGDSYKTASFRTYGEKPWVMKKKFLRDRNKFMSEDFVDTCYVGSVTLYENFMPGSLVKILALDQNNRWKVIWENKDFEKVINEKARIFQPELDIKDKNLLTNTLQLEFNHTKQKYYYQLAGVSINNKNNNKYNQNNIKNNEVINNNNNPNNIHTKSKNNNNKNTNKNNNNISETGSSVDIEDYTENKPQLASNNIDKPSSSSNLFTLLPFEVISNILFFLDLKSLCRLSITCRLLYKLTYADKKQYKQVDMQAYWHQCTNSAMDQLSLRCHGVQSLNLAWCRLLTNIDGFLEKHGKSLLKIDLSSCFGLRNIQPLHKLCPNLQEVCLDNFHPLNHHFFHSLSFLHHLKHLSLYRSTIDSETVLLITKNCKKLESLFLASCLNLSNEFNHFYNALFNHCRSLVALDLSRHRHLSDISSLIGQHLRYLDLSFCDGLKSSDHTYNRLASSCPNLVYLNLSLHRSIIDEDIVEISLKCSLLEYLHLSGVFQITFASIKRLLEENAMLRWLDISYCSSVDLATLQNFLSSHPHITHRVHIAVVGLD